MTYQSEVLADSPVGFWPMTEAAAPLANSGSDSSTLAANGSMTMQLAALLATDAGMSPYLSGGYFTGPNALYSSQAGASGKLTLEAWVKIGALTGGTQMLVTKGNNSPAYEFSMALNFGGANHGLSFGVHTYDGNNVAGLDGNLGLSLATGTLYHLAGTFDRANSLLYTYVNGVQDGSVTSGFSGNSSATGSQFQVGHRQSDGVSFVGDIGWVAIYPTALSAARVLAHYNAGIGAGPPLSPDRAVPGLRGVLSRHRLR